MGRKRLATPWKQTIKYCGFHPRGYALAKAARKRICLTGEQVSLIEALAGEVSIYMSGDNIELPANLASCLPVTLPGIFKDKVEVVRKGNWVVEGSGKPGVIGKIDSNRIILYPNPHVTISELEELLFQDIVQKG